MPNIINSPLYDAQHGKVGNFPPSALTQGKLRIAAITIIAGTVLAAGDKINLVELPEGARVQPVNSVTINGGAAVVNIGDAEQPDRYAAALTGAPRKAFTDFGNKPDADVSAGNETLVATVTSGATLAADWTLYVAFVTV